MEYYRVWTRYSLDKPISDTFSKPMIQEIANFYQNINKGNLDTIFIRINDADEALIIIRVKYFKPVDIKQHYAVKSLYMETSTSKPVHIKGNKYIWNDGIRYGSLSYSRTNPVISKLIYMYIKSDLELCNYKLTLAYGSDIISLCKYMNEKLITHAATNESHIYEDAIASNITQLTKSSEFPESEFDCVILTLTKPWQHMSFINKLTPKTFTVTICKQRAESWYQNYFSDKGYMLEHMKVFNSKSVESSYGEQVQIWKKHS